MAAEDAKKRLTEIAETDVVVELPVIRFAST